MKTFFLTPVFFIVLISCKAEARVDLPKTKDTDGSFSKTSTINGFKNGKPFINYLGEKIDKC